MVVLVSSGIGLLLMLLMIFVHFQTLELISNILRRVSLPHRLWITVIMLGVYIGHSIEIGLFGLAYYLLHQFTTIGDFTPEFEPTVINYIYFSATSYVTLGLSSFNPEKGFKIIAAGEALCGFLLITWSASFGYTAMKDFWNE